MLSLSCLICKVGRSVSSYNNAVRFKWSHQDIMGKLMVATSNQIHPLKPGPPANERPFVLLTSERWTSLPGEGRKQIDAFNAIQQRSWRRLKEVMILSHDLQISVHLMKLRIAEYFTKAVSCHMRVTWAIGKGRKRQTPRDS
jgi:hypothetical protein